jgi:hypothetical protein
MTIADYLASGGMRDAAYRPPDLTQTYRSPESQPARQSDLETEP